MNFFERFREDPFAQSIYLLLLFVSVLLHEYGHAWAALLMGDNTNTHRGRFIWDPRYYINWLGFALFLLIGFGPLGRNRSIRTNTDSVSGVKCSSRAVAC